MMAMRFRSMGLVAAVALAALACYMVSLKVAAERFALVRIEGRVLAAKQEIRRLQTELGTRGRLVQLERWNADVLALSAPKAAQYLEGEFQLANYARPTGALPNVIPVSAPAPAPAIPAAPKVETVAFEPPSAPSAQPASQPLLREATYIKPAGSRLGPQKVSLLDDGLLGEIGKAAAAEAKISHTRR